MPNQATTSGAGLHHELATQLQPRAYENVNVQNSAKANHAGATKTADE